MVKKYTKIWWEGFKIFCGWSLFEIILLPLWLPAMALHSFFGEVAGGIIGFVLAIPIVPIIFFLIFKFLLLFIDQEQNNAESDGDSTGIKGKRNFETKKAIVLRRALVLYLIFLSFSIIAAIITPPDLVTQITAIAIMVIIFGILVFIISRFKSFAHTPETIKNLIIVLVCLLSITITYSLILSQWNHRLRAERSKQVTSTNPPEAAKF